MKEEKDQVNKENWMDPRSEEYAHYLKKEKENLISYLEKAREADKAYCWRAYNGTQYIGAVAPDGSVFISSADSNRDDPRDWFVVYCSIDTYLLHHYPEHNDQDNIACNAYEIMENNLCNFSNPKEFYLEETDGTGHRPGPFGPRGWHKGIIVCSSKQIQEIRRRIDKGEAFTEEMIIEINPIAIYKTFEAYCRAHKSAAPIIVQEIEIPTEQGWKLNPNRPKWITERDWFCSDPAWDIAEPETLKKYFPDATEEELIQITEKVDFQEEDAFRNRRGLGYLNYCRYHGIEIPKCVFEALEKYDQNRKRRADEEFEKYRNDEKVKEAIELHRKECAKRGEKSLPEFERFWAEEAIREIKAEEAQKRWEATLKKAYEIAELDEKGIKKFFWGRDVIDPETLKIYEEEG